MNLSKAARPPRVANVIEEGRWGGPQARICMVAKALKARGLHTVVFLPRMGSETFRSRLEAAGVAYEAGNLHRLTRETSVLLRYLFFFIPEVTWLVRGFRRHQVDLVHANGLWQIKAILAGKIAGIKVVWHLNDSFIPSILMKLFGALLPLADGIIVASAKTCSFYSSRWNLSRKPLEEIQAPVDVLRFDPETVKPDPDLQGKDKIKIVTVANLNPAKGLEVFVEMAHRLQQKQVPVELYVVGARFSSQNQYAENLERRVRDYGLNGLHFLGPRQDIPEILKAADVYVCSSVNEASPLSVWEAMAMGLPVVSTDVGDVARFVSQGEGGYIVPVGDAEALAEGVQKLVENPEQRAAFGKLNRRRAQTDLNVDAATDLHYRFYCSFFCSN